MNRYIVNIYSGKAYCGNGFFNTIDECYTFAMNEGFIDEMVILDKQTNHKMTIKIQEVE